jgi:NADP-dependent aldehyde dehydrogenase
MTMITDQPVPDTSPAEVSARCAGAAAAADELSELGTWPPARRGRLLRAIADALDEHRSELVALADLETHLGAARLTGEVARTTAQLRLHATVAEAPATLGVVADVADLAAVPVPHPALRRFLRPIGPVAVFAASNFPFAFSVAGGDTASALAAGCPVVLKEHPGHPRTSARTAELVVGALERCSAPAGTFATVRGLHAGSALVVDPRIRAAAFTGSLRGGRTLFDLATRRPDPIPFYGELGSLNPVFATAAAVTARGREIAEGFVRSVTLGAGQFCTKPGLLLLPRRHGLAPALIDTVRAAPPSRLLTSAISDAFAATREQLGGIDGVRTLVAVEDSGGGSGACLFAVSAEDLTSNAALFEECFGPAALVVDYGSETELLELASAIPGSLTASVHAEPDDDEMVRRLVARLARRCGRIVYNGWPTGVAVSRTMHHGGPWPATTSPLHTSVGTTAVDRFLVPVVLQSVPRRLLPHPLQEGTNAGTSHG